MNYFISDTHFFHTNIIKYCNRPFNSAQEMQGTTVSNWKSKITEKDHVFFLGDFCMNPSSYWVLGILPFDSMDFILGNHDKEKRLLKYLDCNPHIKSKIKIHRNLEIELKEQKFFLTHYPIECSDTMPSIVGHSHNRFTFLPAGSTIKSIYRHNGGGEIVKVLKHPILNVGVDNFNFHPVSEDEVLKFFESKNITIVDVLE